MSCTGCERNAYLAVAEKERADEAEAALAEARGAMTLLDNETCTCPNDCNAKVERGENWTCWACFPSDSAALFLAAHPVAAEPTGESDHDYDPLNEDPV